MSNYRGMTLDEEVSRMHKLMMVEGYDQHNLTLPEIQNILSNVMDDKNMAMRLAPVCLAQIQVESGGNPNIVSRDGYGSVGILQLLPGTAIDLGYNPNDRLDVNKNIEMYGKYMNKYKPANEEQAARMWNGGPKGYTKPATAQYWQKVQSVMAKQGNSIAITGGAQNGGFFSNLTGGQNSGNWLTNFFSGLFG